jgi:aldehyde dehydrogenase
VQESIYDDFMKVVMKKIVKIKRGNPLDTDTMVGAQASEQQYDKILSYLKIAQEEGAELLTGGAAERWRRPVHRLLHPADPAQGHNKMRVFQEEIFGPVVGITTFKDEAEALAIANDTEFGLAPACGPATSTVPTAWAARSRPVACGPTATTCTRRTPRSAATRSPASAVRTTR